MEDYSQKGSKTKSKRSIKWNRKFTLNQNIFGNKPDFYENKYRKIPKAFHFFQNSFLSSKVDVLENLENEEASCRTLASPYTVNFENKIFSLLSRCQEYCPQVYSKLNKYLKKAMAKTSKSKDKSEKGKNS